ELESIGHPVDLVGHDWGGGHVLYVAMARPDLVRTWVSDIVGVLDEDYVWHDLAQQWQTPDQGEAVIAAMTAQPAEARAAALVGGGMNPAIANRVASGIDESMGACILRLYRSAALVLRAPVQRPCAQDQSEHDDRSCDADAHPHRHRVDVRQRGGGSRGGGVGGVRLGGEQRGIGFDQRAHLGAWRRRETVVEQ